MSACISEACEAEEPSCDALGSLASLRLECAFGDAYAIANFVVSNERAEFRLILPFMPIIRWRYPVNFQQLISPRYRVYMDYKSVL
jgi:hypothetical protein